MQIHFLRVLGRSDGRKRRKRVPTWNGESFYWLEQAQLVIENWRVEYNTRRRHSAVGNRPPAREAFALRMAVLRLLSAPCEPPFARPFPSEVVL